MADSASLVLIEGMKLLQTQARRSSTRREIDHESLEGGSREPFETFVEGCRSFCLQGLRANYAGRRVSINNYLFSVAFGKLLM
jgi:hypothetical protein